jgi:hypothetical protein
MHTSSLLSDRPADASTAPIVGPRSRPARLPLSDTQRSLWLLDRLRGDSRDYHMVERLDFDRMLDDALLTRAVNALVARHEALRTRFAIVDGEPSQIVEPTLHVDVPVEDLRACGAEARAARLQAVMREELERPFDLARLPLIRLRYILTGPEASVLVRTTHHIVCDGSSQGIFDGELGALYAAAQADGESALPSLALQYADFTLWQRDPQREAHVRDALHYWTTQLANPPARLCLPSDRERPETPTLAAGVTRRRVAAATTDALSQLCASHGATTYMGMLAAFAALLARHTGQHDVLIGCPAANRPTPETRKLIGFFANMMPLRIRVPLGSSFRDLLAQVRDTAREAYSRQDVPFDRVVEALGLSRRQATAPLVQVAFVQRVPAALPVIAGVHVTRAPDDTRPVRFEIEVHLDASERPLQMSWIYDGGLFDEWRILQLAEHYERFVAAVAADPDLVIADVPLLTSDERQRLLHGDAVRADRQS